MAQPASALWYPRILRDIDRLLGRRLTAAQCRALVQQRLAEREERFLAVARTLIYAHPASPYLPLLQEAGCAFGDLAALVRGRGLEATLRALRDAGVSLSFEEFKRGAEVRRGSATYQFGFAAFDNPTIRGGIEFRTGASRSPGSPVATALESVAVQQAPYIQMALTAAGVPQGPVILWLPAFPATGLILGVLSLALLGRTPYRWFSRTDLHDPVVAPRHRLLIQSIRLLALRRGLRLPPLEYIPIAQSATVLDAVLAARGHGGPCVVVTSPSAAVRLAGLARQRGTQLSGVRFIVSSEPLTPGKAAEIRRAGASAWSQYGTTETGLLALACGTPQATDDMHFATDCFSVIPNSRTVPGGGAIETFMLTTLLPTAPKVMLNVEIDDFGGLTERRCGCLFDELGLYHHVQEVRSFTKLTGEGATVIGSDCVRILEEVLPREFGGRSIDYQLLEAEDDDHLTRLFLVVSPTVGAVDEQALRRRFVEELRRRNAPGLRLWAQADSVRVVRREPFVTPRGKVLPFHTQALAMTGAPALAETTGGGTNRLVRSAAFHPGGRDGA